MSPRIDPVTDLDEDQSALLRKTLRGPGGEALNVFSTLVRQPELMKRINAMGGYFFTFSDLTMRERETVILRVASRIDCSYELGQHRWIAASVGLSEEEIEDAIGGRSSDARECVLLRVADELLDTDKLSDATWSTVVEYVGTNVTVELIVLVGYYRMLGNVLNAVQVELDPSVRAVLDSADVEAHPK